jgi:hypothetical protein
MNPVTASRPASFRYISNQGDILQSLAATSKFRGQEGLHEASPMPRTNSSGTNCEPYCHLSFFFSARCMSTDTHFVREQQNCSNYADNTRLHRAKRDRPGTLHICFNINPTIHSPVFWKVSFLQAL